MYYWKGVKKARCSMQMAKKEKKRLIKPTYFLMIKNPAKSRDDFSISFSSNTSSTIFFLLSCQISIVRKLNHSQLNSLYY